jgi:hypothetical protein
MLRVGFVMTVWAVKESFYFSNCCGDTFLLLPRLKSLSKPSQYESHQCRQRQKYKILQKLILLVQNNDVSASDNLALLPELRMLASNYSSHLEWN